MIRLALSSIFLATAAFGLGEDYITVAPATVYEATEMSPQNMDFDKENNMFTAHPGWYEGNLIHYYKFRMFTPSTYKGVIAPGSSFADVPTQKVFIVTTSGDLSGAIGKPIIEYHTADGISYSDFMEIYFVKVTTDYTEDQFKSLGDIESSAAETIPSGIILNFPVVPTDSILQDPHEDDDGTSSLSRSSGAPIAPVFVWYKGVEVQTYIFEVTDQKAADYFAWTRDDPNDMAYKIYVIDFATPNGEIIAIRIWHVNQYTQGVTLGENGGGPSPAGMRNIINLDRKDLGYSPNWQVYWMTELPINYSADEATDNDQLTADAGFAEFVTPMFVNCPNIGNIIPKDIDKDVTFETTIDTQEGSSWILGSHKSLIMKKDVPVSFQTTDGVEIDSTATNMMGAYEHELDSSLIPEGTTEIVVVANGTTAIRTIAVKQGVDDPSSGYGNKVSMLWFLLPVFTWLFA